MVMENCHRIAEENAINVVWRNRSWMIASEFSWLCIFLEVTLLRYGGEVW
jgi:hypothetical protein